MTSIMNQPLKKDCSGNKVCKTGLLKLQRTLTVILLKNIISTSHLLLRKNKRLKTDKLKSQYKQRVPPSKTVSMNFKA